MTAGKNIKTNQNIEEKNSLKRFLFRSTFQKKDSELILYNKSINNKIYFEKCLAKFVYFINIYYKKEKI